MADHRDYILGTDSSEADRLGAQHRLWSESAAAIWQRAGVRIGSRVLDLGCGPGFASADLAQTVGPLGWVTGVEGSPDYAAQFRDRMAAMGLAHTEAIEGDLHELTSLLGDRVGTFDAAYTRWVPCFLRDPASVFAQARDALKPGGRLAIQDYFAYDTMRLAPRVGIFERVIAALGVMWNETGDLDVMGRAPGMLREAGFELTDFRILHRIARPNEPLWDWPSIFWPNFVPRAVEAGAVSASDAEAFFEAWDTASSDPDAFMMMPPVFEAVAVRL